MTELSNKIIDTIKKEAVVMKPRYYFVLRTLLTITGVLLVTLISLYGLSFVLFILRESGVWFLPHFGAVGFLWFITHSPWIIITITLLFLGTLFLLIRHFRFSYQQPTIYTLLALVLVVIGGASLLEYIAIHDKVRDFSQLNNVPKVAQFYDKQTRMMPEGVTPGEVVAIRDNVITIETPHNEFIEVTLTNTTKLPKNPLIEGNHVFVFGPRTASTTIEAIGVKLVDGPMKRAPKPPRPY